MFSFVNSLARSLNLVWVLQSLISHGKAFHRRIPLFMKEFRANSVLKVVFSEIPEDVANLVPYWNCLLVLLCRKSGFPSNLILRINTRLCSTTICLTDNHPHWCSKVATGEFQGRRVTILAALFWTTWSKDIRLIPALRALYSLHSCAMEYSIY